MKPHPSLSADDSTAPPPSDALRFERTHIWEVILGMLAVGVLYLWLPTRLLIGPSWLLLIIEVAFLLPIIWSVLTGRGLPSHTLRPLLLVLLGVLTLALASSVALLLLTLPADRVATTLLRAAALLWLCNILIFGLWYWQIDGGGPARRHQAGHQAADVLFPQQANGNPTAWAPHFMDYLFLAFTGATALSPADTLPLTRRAKVLMMLEALLSLLIIALLAARAINILGG